MYDLKIYVSGVVVKEYKNMDYDLARYEFMNHNRSWECYPELYIDGDPQKLKHALKHFEFNAHDMPLPLL